MKYRGGSSALAISTVRRQQAFSSVSMRWRCTSSAL